MKSNEKIEAFFRNLSNSPSSLLMLDYDGTLAPFKKERNEATPDPMLIEQVQTLMTTQKCHVVIISGRFLADLIPLLRMTPLPELWGSHGLENRNLAGETTSFSLPARLEALLQKEEQALSTEGLMAVERKPYSLAIHWRGQPEEEARRLEKLSRQRWNKLKDDFEICTFDGGIELRLPGKGKGDAVRKILSKMENNTPVAYVGDDLTDEDAFAAMGNRGLKVLLRHHQKKSLANVELKTTEDLREFLGRWINTLRNDHE